MKPQYLLLAAALAGSGYAGPNYSLETDSSRTTQGMPEGVQLPEDFVQGKITLLDCKDECRMWVENKRFMMPVVFKDKEAELLSMVLKQGTEITSQMGSAGSSPFNIKEEHIRQIDAKDLYRHENLRTIEGRIIAGKANEHYVFWVETDELLVPYRTSGETAKTLAMRLSEGNRIQIQMAANVLYAQGANNISLDNILSINGKRMYGTRKIDEVQL